MTGWTYVGPQSLCWGWSSSCDWEPVQQDCGWVVARRGQWLRTTILLAGHSQQPNNTMIPCRYYWHYLNSNQSIVVPNSLRKNGVNGMSVKRHKLRAKWICFVLTGSRQREETVFLLHFQILFLRWECRTRCCCCRRCWWNNFERFTFLCLQFSYVLRCFIASTAWKLWSSPLWDRRGNKMKFVSDQSWNLYAALCSESRALLPAG